MDEVSIDKFENPVKLPEMAKLDHPISFIYYQEAKVLKRLDVSFRLLFGYIKKINKKFTSSLTYS